MGGDKQASPPIQSLISNSDEPFPWYIILRSKKGLGGGLKVQVNALAAASATRLESSGLTVNSGLLGVVLKD